jgi:hypothetical protein
MKPYGIKSFLFIVIILLLSLKPVVAQSSADDSLFYKKAVNNLINLYQLSSGDQTALFNGSQYSKYPFKFENENHSYFFANGYGLGSVEYDGILYENLTMQYDEVQEALVVDSSSRLIQLINERVTQFKLFGNNFVRLVRDTQSTELVRTGYYNLLYEGNTTLLKREEKFIRDDVSTGTMLHFIDRHVYYYLKTNNSYYSFSSKGSFFSIFKDKKKNIRQFVRKNKLSYRKDRDNMLTKATEYYDQLTK